MKLSRTVLVTSIVIAGIVFGSAGCATTVQMPSPLEKAVANAKTKSDHEAVAQAYDRSAATARAEAQRHRDLAKAYLGTPGSRGSGALGMASHCEDLASLYEKAAGEYSELAKAHRSTSVDAK
ncbi:MAG: hypothetical protein K2X67_05135 [Burkholderiales bacterium]|nr:hypothetical protein [Burkholderiales bacterium]